MRGVRKFLVFMIGSLSFTAAVASGAGAVTWHNTGDTAYTASGTAMTFSATGVNLTCTSFSETGTSPSGSTVGTTFAGFTGTETYN